MTILATASPMRIGYARVSTGDQTTNLQLDALNAAGCDQIFEDVVSGSSRKRPGLEQALAAVGAGDKLVVWRLDRLGRDFPHLVEIAEALRSRGANFLSISEGIDTGSLIGETIYRLISALADMERKVIIERTIAGLAAARRRGSQLGRRPKLAPERMAAAVERMETPGTVREIADEFGVCRATLYRYRNRQKRRDVESGRVV